MTVGEGVVVAVCISEKRGMKKHAISQGRLKKNHGLEGDAHTGSWHRQVSLLAEESIDKMRSTGLELSYGDFAENIACRGLILHTLPVGTRLRIGESALVEVTQIGKECHEGCEIYKQVGECIMPREGVFVRVIEDGIVKAGDTIRVVS